MKYYTKEFYAKMQVSAFILFPPSKEEWNELVQSFYEDEIDYIENSKIHFEFIKSDLLKYLPVSLHNSIHDKTLVTEYPSEENMKIINQWRETFNAESERLRFESIEKYELLKNELPKSIVQLHQESLHDADVISFKYISEKQECSLILKHHKDGEYIKVKLTFTGIKELTLDEDIENAVWIYDEVYNGSDCFELNVLFENPLTEFCIKAQELIIENLG